MKILFIAEASSAGTREFYNANNLLYHTVKKAFEEEYGSFADDDGFLQFFKEKGFGLEHLCVKTITKESAAKRAEARKKCIPSLAERIKKEKPEMIIILMRSILEEVAAAIRLSGVNTVRMIRSTAYPGLSAKHRQECILGVRKALHEATAAGII